MSYKFNQTDRSNYIYSFLQELGFTEYFWIFEDKQVNVASLPYLTREHLLEIPIGPRNKILLEIKKASDAGLLPSNP